MFTMPKFITLKSSGLQRLISPKVMTPAHSVMSQHTLFEDVQALITGILLISVGLALFKYTGLVTGGAVGLAFLLHYLSGLTVEHAFFLLNVPFYVVAWQRLGPRFAIKTMIAVITLTLCSGILPEWIALRSVNPLFAAIGGGLMIGVGLLILFRHRASLGGLNVIILWCQEKFGWRAGYIQLVVDSGILLASLPWLNLHQVMLSIIAAMAMNFALAINHRPGRYMAI